MNPHGNEMAQNALRLVFWELTSRCNLKCRHCRAEAQDEFAVGELTTEEMLRVARDVREVGDPIMILSGGEPLARPDFFEIATCCTGLFSRVALATNGTLVDDALAKRIVDTGIARASISLDGACAATHDGFRGISGSFDDALRGLRALRGAGLSVQINVTVTRHNEGELDDLLELVDREGADAFHVFMLVPVGCGAEIGEDDRLTPARFEEVLRWLFEKSIELGDKLHVKATCAPQYHRIMREMAKEKGISLSPGAGHGHGGAGHPGGSPHGGMNAMTRGCLAGSSVCFISKTGDVQPCGYLPVVAGNVLEQSMRDIWAQSDVFAQLRDPDQLKGKCGACGYRKVCEGCRARAFAETGDFMEAEPDCPYVPGKLKG